MTKSVKVQTDPAAWSTHVAPDEWVEDAPWSHHDPAFAESLRQARHLTELSHNIVTSLGALRRARGLSQVEVAQRWGKAQSYVSRVERDPTTVEMGTLIGYVQALGGRLTLTIEVGDHVFCEGLVET